MPRGPRVRLRDAPKKPGPKSRKEKAVQPRRAGQAKRRQFRANNKRSKMTMHRYCNGYKMIWSKAGRYVRRLAHFPKPNTCDPLNQQGGYMPALPGEINLTGKQAAAILEKCAEAEGTREFQAMS